MTKGALQPLMLGLPKEWLCQSEMAETQIFQGLPAKNLYQCDLSSLDAVSPIQLSKPQSTPLHGA
jgi:hypothetical protein